jgi:hypothetical protein
MAVLCGVVLSSGFAQTAGGGFPPAVLTAKTIAVVDDTREKDVEKGAEETLASWGQFRVIEDPTLADVTLRFDKSREHDGQSTQKTDANGKPTDYGYSMSFSSSIHMKAYLKDGETPFYTTKTDDSKRKAGVSCVNDFHAAYRAAWQKAHPAAGPSTRPQ